MKRIIKTTRRELFRLVEGGEELRRISGIKNRKFSYPLFRTQDLVSSEFKLFNKLKAPSKEIIKYQKERIALCLKYCDKDKNNKPVTTIDDGKEVYVFSGKNKVKFDKETISFEKKNKEVLEEITEIDKEIIKTLDEQIEFEVYGIEQADIPDDISASELRIIKILLPDEVKPKKVKSKRSKNNK